MNRVDKVLFYLMWASAFSVLIASLWFIIKVTRLNPELEVFISMLIPLIVFIFVLVMKVGRIQERDESSNQLSHMLGM